ncbi:OmpH family outer membrane protein [Lutibacter sp. HS1-25]|uniref:OmpH family outer membrane protein n=1 Tax=Lutibacter sp. HS1-25 TaxID=2485000 RepID=UPI001012E3C2|nr:OmpH family outer membrane protein [Lutibacter sp. HS1-25]RXP45895.1 OmpH family outer membrane protein [Lutibacter sp. HS1-25]
MIKKAILYTFLLTSFILSAQKAQRFGYVDMQYVLENIPEYNEAQAKINAKANTWKNNLDAKQKEIDALIADLSNEKALLTKELIEDKEEDIQIKELELKKLQNAYFGTDGDLFFLRRQLVKPIQDLVFNAVQDIAVKRKYDFVFDKSTDLIMLYTNKQYDISDLVLTNISRAQKAEAIDEKRNERNKETTQSPVLSEDAQQKVDERELKRAELQSIQEEKRAEQLRKREELIKANEAKRLERINGTSTKIQNTTEDVEAKVVEDEKVTEDALQETEEPEVDPKELRRIELQKSIEAKRAEQLKKREELLKANEAKKQQRIKDIEDAKKAKEEQQENN